MFVRHAARLFALCACSTLAPASPALAEAPGGAPATAPAPAAAATQPGRPPAPDATRLREAMKPFLPAVGHWRGEGWTQMGPGEPQRSVSEETVEMRLDGLVLVIEGLHHAKLPDGSAGKVVHHALAIVSADSADPAGGFRFSTFLADGRAADARGAWENGKFVWAPPAPPGRQIRYVVDWSVADRWSEIGEMSTDGTTWTKFFEMNLTRTAP
jgi:hypothetical protein